MYRKVLVPLDGSELSECSLRHAKAIATGCHVADVVLLRVVEDAMPNNPEIPEDLRARIAREAEPQARSYLAKMADGLKKEGVAVETAVEKGRAADVILNYARKNNVDLIIMSTHGYSGISRWAFGGVTDRIVRHSPIPVLTVAPAGCRVG